MKGIVAILLITLITFSIAAQENNFQIPLSINTDGSSPHPSAMLEIQSNDKGILIPRVTNTSVISTPAEGLLVYQTEAPKGFYYFDGSIWQPFGLPSPFRLENLNTTERDMISPLPGMMIYNTDVGRPEFYRIGMPSEFGGVTNNGNTETGCTSIAQSFKPNTSTSITDIEAKIDFNGNTNDVTLKIYDGEGIGGSVLYTEVLSFGSIPVQNGNEYQFILTNALPVTCCGVKTFEITQAGNTNMTAHINFQDMVSFNVSTGGVSPDPYTDGKFYKDGTNNDNIDASGLPILVVTSRDLHFVVNHQFKGWVTQ